MSRRTGPSGTQSAIQKTDSNKRLSIDQVSTETEKRGFHNADIEDSSLLGCEAEKQSFIPDISKEHTENVNGLFFRNIWNL